MRILTVLVSAILLINIVVTQQQSSRELDFEGTHDLNQLCGPLDEASVYEDGQPAATDGCKLRQQIYDVMKRDNEIMWEYKNETGIANLFTRDVVVYNYMYEEPIRGLEAWSQIFMHVFEHGHKAKLIAMLEFAVCGRNPQALVLWSWGPGIYARTFSKFKIEDGRWKIYKDISQKIQEM